MSAAVVVVVVVVSCCPKKELRFVSRLRTQLLFAREFLNDVPLCEKQQHHSVLKICDYSNDPTVLVDVLTVEGQDH